MASLGVGSCPTQAVDMNVEAVWRALAESQSMDPLGRSRGPLLLGQPVHMRVRGWLPLRLVVTGIDAASHVLRLSSYLRSVREVVGVGVFGREGLGSVDGACARGIHVRGWREVR